MNLFSLCALLGRSRSKACGASPCHRRHSCSKNAKAQSSQLKPSDCLKLAFAGAGKGRLLTAAASKSRRRVWLAASHMLGLGRVSQYLTVRDASLLRCTTSKAKWRCFGVQQSTNTDRFLVVCQLLHCFRQLLCL